MDDDTLSTSSEGETEEKKSNTAEDEILKASSRSTGEKVHYESNTSEIRELKFENEKLKMKNEEQAKTIANLLDSAEKLKKTLSDTQIKASNQTKHITSLSAKVKELKEKLAYAVADTLRKEEELSKKESSIDRLREEKQKLNNSLSSRNSDKDEVKQLQTQVSDLQDDLSTLKMDNSDTKQKLQTTVSLADFQIMKLELQNLLKKEIHDHLTKQTEGRKEIEKQTTETSCQKQNVVDLTMDDGTTTTESVLGENPKSKVLIIGDSATRNLNPTRMSDRNIEVTVNSNPGMSIAEMKNRVPELQSKHKNMKKFDVFMIHGGSELINEETDATLMNYEQTVKAIRKENKTAKIVISSILPQLRNKPSVRDLSENNEKLQQYCHQENLGFVDHSKNFLFRETKPDRRLFLHDGNLSDRGTAMLAKGLKGAIRQALNIDKTIQPKSAANFRRPSLPRRQWKPPFHRGPQTWIPPWMRLVPKWGFPPKY